MSICYFIRVGGVFLPDSSPDELVFELIESVSSESASGFVIDCCVSEICVKSDSEFSSAVRSITFDTVGFLYFW